MKSLRLPGRFALLFVFLTWGYFLLYLPTFDFDESLYRRVAEEMKLSHNFWHMAWDTWPVYHKPPIFYWLIWFFSNLIDGPTAGVSSLAARLPNFFATIGIMASLYWGGKKVSDGSARAGWAPVLAFICALFPVLTATTVIFDPLQTLVLMPSLLIPTLMFHRNLQLKPIHWIVWTLSLFASCALKGLNGLIVPSAALAFHLLLNLHEEGFRTNFRIGLRYLGFAFLPAAALTAAFYAGLDHWIGRPFTHEFLWVQHFERSQVPMEEHSGSFFYHFFVIFFGGGFLIPLLLDRAFRTKMSYAKQGFPLSFALAFILVFSFTATKLPHYTWPVWPAFALFFGILLSLVRETPAPLSDASPSQRIQRVIAFLPVLLLGMAMLALATEPETVLQSLSKSIPFQRVIKHFEGFLWWERGCFYLGAIACFLCQVRRRTITASVEACALLASLAAFCLTLGIGRTAKNFMVTPFEDISEALRLHGAKPGDCIRSSGAQSPTFSLALGSQILHNRCEPEDMKFLVTPEWKSEECQLRGLVVLEQKSYLILCGKK